MKIAQQLKNTNIAEYVLYMFQIEDILRAYACDADRLRDDYVARFAWEPGEKKAEAEWMEGLCQQMKEEERTASGHLQGTLGTIALMTDLHLQMLQSTRQPFYSAAYYKALPFIVEYRAKSRGEEVPEVQNCLELMYAIMLLRLQKKEISRETQEAAAAVSRLLALLADAWRKERSGELEL